MSVYAVYCTLKINVRISFSVMTDFASGEYRNKSMVKVPLLKLILSGFLSFSSICFEDSDHILIVNPRLAFSLCCFRCLLLIRNSIKFHFVTVMCGGSIIRVEWNDVDNDTSVHGSSFLSSLSSFHAFCARNVDRDTILSSALPPTYPNLFRPLNMTMPLLIGVLFLIEHMGERVLLSLKWIRFPFAAFQGPSMR